MDNKNTKKQSGSNLFIGIFFFLLHITFLGRFLLKIFEPGTEETQRLFMALEPVLPLLDHLLWVFLLPAEGLVWVLNKFMPASLGLSSSFPSMLAADFFEGMAYLLIQIPGVQGTEIEQSLISTVYAAEFPGTIEWVYLIALGFWLFIESLTPVVLGYIKALSDILKREYQNHQIRESHQQEQNRMQLLREESKRKHIDKSIKQKRQTEVREVIDDFKQEIKQLQEKTNKDALTGLYNRGFFNHAVKQKIMDAYQGKLPYSLVMMDIDNFKSLNDTYGHLLGDQVLRNVGEIILDNSPSDMVLPCRYGGEEIALVMVGLTHAQAESLAESIRKQIARLRFDADPALQVTISMGLYSVEFTGGLTPERLNENTLIQRADELLYQAKHQGKNQVCSEMF